MHVSNVATTIRISSKDHDKDHATYFNNVKSRFVFALRGIRKCKVRLTHELAMYHCDIYPIAKVLETKTEILIGDTGKIYDRMINEMIERIDTLVDNGSGWEFVYSKSLILHILKFTPFSGGDFTKLPKELELKKALINMKSNDNFCFMWCITRHFNPVEDGHPPKVSNLLKEQSETFYWSDLEFSIQLNSIGKFEKKNKIAVNVYGYSDKETYPLRISKTSYEIVNLLYHDNHYVLIKNLHRLISSEIANGKYLTHFCHRCMVGFTSEQLLESHSKVFKRNFAAVLPKARSSIEVNDHNKQMYTPFVIYADFECFIENDLHVPSSYCYYVKSFDDKVLPSRFESVIIKNRDNDVAQHFVDMIINEANEMVKLYTKNVKMILKPSDLKQFDEAVDCHICGKELGDDRVKDPCHLTGKYRGAAHSECNINYNMPTFLPVFFHNLSGYDAHLFITKFKTDDSRTLKCIPHTEEKFISFSYSFPIGKNKFEIRFLDSYKFMSTSDKLAKIASDFSNLEKYFSNTDLLKAKGVYPYEWVSLERMDDKQLPSIECFYSKLRGSEISESEYEMLRRCGRCLSVLR